MRFSLSQHARDEQLLRNLIYFLDCGKVDKNINIKNNIKDFFIFRVENFKDIDSKIIPFFLKYPIVGTKLLDFQDFCKVAEIMREKAHLTISGLDEIRLIKERMNDNRII